MAPLPILTPARMVQLEPMWTLSPMCTSAAVAVRRVPFKAFGSFGVFSVSIVTFAPMVEFLPMLILPESNSLQCVPMSTLSAMERLYP